MRFSSSLQTRGVAFSSWLKEAPATSSLAAVVLFFFLVQKTMANLSSVYGTFADFFQLSFGLNGSLLFSGPFFWQPVTYLFLHAGWAHLLLNLLGLIVFGRAIEYAFGSRTFLRIFFLGGILGGLFWLFFTWLLPMFPALGSLTAWIPQEAVEILKTHFGISVGAATIAPFGATTCMGASGAVYALVGGFIAAFPRRVLSGLIFFIPFRMKARTLGVILIFFSLVSALLIQSQVAESAHLAGGFLGYFWMRRVVRKRMKTEWFSVKGV